MYKTFNIMHVYTLNATNKSYLHDILNVKYHTNRRIFRAVTLKTKKSTINTTNSNTKVSKLFDNNCIVQKMCKIF